LPALKLSSDVENWDIKKEEKAPLKFQSSCYCNIYCRLCTRTGPNVLYGATQDILECHHLLKESLTSSNQNLKYFATLVSYLYWGDLWITQMYAFWNRIM